jgi:hypothetical protein
MINIRSSSRLTRIICNYFEPQVTTFHHRTQIPKLNDIQSKRSIIRKYERTFDIPKKNSAPREQTSHHDATVRHQENTLPRVNACNTTSTSTSIPTPKSPLRTPSHTLAHLYQPRRTCSPSAPATPNPAPQTSSQHASTTQAPSTTHSATGRPVPMTKVRTSLLHWHSYLMARRFRKEHIC